MNWTQTPPTADEVRARTEDHGAAYYWTRWAEDPRPCAAWFDVRDGVVWERGASGGWLSPISHADESTEYLPVATPDEVFHLRRIVEGAETLARAQREEAAALRGEVERLTKEASHLDDIMADRDRYSDVLTDAAAAVECPEEWSNLHEHGDCIINGLAALRQEVDALRSALAAEKARGKAMGMAMALALPVIGWAKLTTADGQWKARIAQALEACQPHALANAAAVLQAARAQEANHRAIGIGVCHCGVCEAVRALDGGK